MRTNKPAVPRERRATTQDEKMSGFRNIVRAFAGPKRAAGVAAPADPVSPAPQSRPAAAPAAPAGATAAAAPAGAPAAKPISKADVEAILAKLADEQDEDL